MITITRGDGLTFVVTYPGRVKTTTEAAKKRAALYEEEYRLDFEIGEVHSQDDHELLLAIRIAQAEGGEMTVSEPELNADAPDLRVVY